MSPSSTGIPRQIRVKLKYSTIISLDTTAYDEHVFAGNSCYDPDVTSTGHQPLGFDQFAAFYNRYRVHASKIEAQFVSASSATATAGIIGVAPLVTNSGPTDINHARERDRSKSRFVAGSAGGPAGRMIKHYISTANVMGINKQSALGNNSLQALTSADPSDLWYWIVYAGTADEVTAVDQQVQVTITYYVTFFDKVPLGQS